MLFNSNKQKLAATNLTAWLVLAMIGVAAVAGCKKSPPPTAPAPVTDAAAPANTVANPTPAAPAGATANPAAVAASAIPLKDPGAFQSSDPNLQAMWTAAITAASNNDWMGTYQGLLQLRSQPGIDADQGKTLDKLISTVGQALMTAANNGDQAAQDAYSQMRRSRRVGGQ